MDKIIFKTKSKPLIEMYEEYIIIREKKSSGNDIIFKTYYREISKMIFVKEENVMSWVMIIFLFFISILGRSSGSLGSDLYTDKLMIYLKDDKGNEGQRFIFNMTNKRKEIDNILNVLNDKLPKENFKIVLNT